MTTSSGFASPVSQYALDNAKQLPVAHLCSIILSFARLNFQPSSSEDFFKMVTSLPPSLGSLGRPRSSPRHIQSKKRASEGSGRCGKGEWGPRSSGQAENPLLSRVLGDRRSRQRTASSPAPAGSLFQQPQAARGCWRALLDAARCN